MNLNQVLQGCMSQDNEVAHPPLHYNAAQHQAYALLCICVSLTWIAAVSSFQPTFKADVLISPAVHVAFYLDHEAAGTRFQIAGIMLPCLTDTPSGGGSAGACESERGGCRASDAQRGMHKQQRRCSPHGCSHAEEVDPWHLEAAARGAQGQPEGEPPESVSVYRRCELPVVMLGCECPF